MTPPPADGPGRAREARPFLKWAGGKRQLLPALRRVVPPRFGTYHEPFLGSAALFFDLSSRGLVGPARLSDTNATLIGCYDAVRRAPEMVVAELRLLADGHATGGAAHYYAVRTAFNDAVARWARAGQAPADCPAALAAALIYLNRTGFNGLFRLNARGEFNVPAGRYEKPRICDADALYAAAAALRAADTVLAPAHWSAVLDVARAGDFVYFDPPYAPLTATARFTSYTAGGFGQDDQRRLADAVVALARRGCHVVLSNSTAPLIVELYEQNPAAIAAGLQALRVPARRAINSDPARRGGVLEFIVTNVPEDGGT